MDLADRLERDLLARDVVEEIVETAIALWNSDDAADDERDRLDQEASRLQAEIQRGTEALFAGQGALATVSAGLREGEQRLGDVRRALADLQHARPGNLSFKGLRPALRRELDDWQGLLRGDTAHARQLLRTVLTGRVVLEPKLLPSGRFYEYRAPTSYRKLLSGIIPARGSVAGSLLEFDMHSDRTLVLNGQRFHYTEWGAPTAPALILLHGVTGHARTWDEEAATLAGSLPRPRPRPARPRRLGSLTATPITRSPRWRPTSTRSPTRWRSLGSRSSACRWAAVSRSPSRARRRRASSGSSLVDIGPDISVAGMTRVGTLMARSPELFPSLEQALAFHRLTNPLYTEAMLRHRVEHGTRPVEGGLTWKYDRGLRDAVRSGTWRDPIDLWPLWRDIACPILLVRGADSDVLSAETAKRMLEENANAHFAEVAGAGHTVPGDQPHAFRTLLSTFLPRVPRRPEPDGRGWGYAGCRFSRRSDRAPNAIAGAGRRGCDQRSGTPRPPAARSATIRASG